MNKQARAYFSEWLSLMEEAYLKLERKDFAELEDLMKKEIAYGRRRNKKLPRRTGARR